MRVVHVLGLALLGCNAHPSAMAVCEKLAAAKVAMNCRATTPGGINAAAVEDAIFDLVATPGKTGAVHRFEKPEAYDRTVEAYSKDMIAALAGPHRYGSRKAMIFVQMNENATKEAGEAAKAVVDGL